jgi:hypothetical protein
MLLATRRATWAGHRRPGAEAPQVPRPAAGRARDPRTRDPRTRAAAVVHERVDRADERGPLPPRRQRRVARRRHEVLPRRRRGGQPLQRGLLEAAGPKERQQRALDVLKALLEGGGDGGVEEG